jgi:tetratricopeptide (TPR) repeat protein
MSDQTENQTLQAQAEAAYQSGAYRQAAETYTSLAAKLESQEDRLTSAEMSNNASVAWMRAGDARAALQACDGTDATFAAAGDLRRQAIALGNQASALDDLGQWKEAIAKYEHSADLLKRVGDKELASITFQSLSALQLKHNRQIDAMVSMQDSLANKSKLTAKESLLRRLMRLATQMMQRPPSI